MSTAALHVAPAPAPAPGVWRRIAPVLAGLVAVVAASSITDAVLHATGVYPPYGQRAADAAFILALAYRIVFGIGGGYLTARLAPSRPLKHALILGTIGLGLSLVGAVATWNSDLGPPWYAVAVAATALPCALAGARLHARA